MKSTAILSPASGPAKPNYPSVRATPRFPAVTLTLVVANLIVWGLFSSSNEQQAASIADSYGFVPVRLTASLTNNDNTAAATELLRSVSSLFVHEQDFFHVGLNMLCLFLFGISVERRLGRLRFAALYLGSGALTCAAYFAICPDGLASYGASSAVCGVLGAYIALFLTRKPTPSLLILAILALNVYCAMTVTQAGFTFFAHLIGFGIGILGVAFLTLQLTPRRTHFYVQPQQRRMS